MDKGVRQHMQHIQIQSIAERMSSMCTHGELCKSPETKRVVLELKLVQSVSQSNKQSILLPV